MTPDEHITAIAAHAEQLTAAVLPCNDGLRRLDVTRLRMTWRWRSPDVTGSPLIVDRNVYAVSAQAGDLFAVDLRNGRVRDRVHIGAVTRFATPAPAGSLLVVGTTTGIVALGGS